MKFNTRPKHELSILTIVLFVIALALAGCGSDTNTQTVEPKTDIKVQMGWVHEYSAAGFYAAEQNGHFATQNLNVKLIEGGFNEEEGYMDPFAQVLEGKADFGLTSPSNLLLARAEGKPVVAIASTIQRNPFALISLAESNIVHPTDLVGKRVAINVGGDPVYNALLSAEGIDPAGIELVTRDSYGIEPLANGEVDVLSGWVINEGVLLEEANLEINTILPSDYGVDTYGTILFTTEQMVIERSDVVEGFLQALIQGHQDVIADPEQATDLILIYADDLNPEEQQRRLQASLPLIKPAGKEIGMMQAELWNLNHQILLEQGILEQPLDVEAVYTLDFLEKVYAAK